MHPWEGSRILNLSKTSGDVTWIIHLHAALYVYIIHIGFETTKLFSCLRRSWLCLENDPWYLWRQDKARKGDINRYRNTSIISVPPMQICILYTAHEDASCAHLRQNLEILRGAASAGTRQIW